MKYLLLVLSACIFSLLVYLLVFGFVVSRPLVVDQVRDFMDKKLAYADATEHPKLFIVAGSNARFSHSCAVLEADLHMRCVNMGIAADVSLDWTLDNVRQRLVAGDMVYMPLEYDIYSRSKADMMTGMDAAYRFRHDKASLSTRNAEGVMRAAFMFSLPTLIQSIGEMSLKAMGVRRRFNLDTMDKQGDEIGHDGNKAKTYIGVIRNASPEFPGKDLLSNPSGAQATIERFLIFCRDHRVKAVGGLPTVFDDSPIPAVDINLLRNFYAHYGANFVVMGNRSQYPRTEFYDMGYHLRQSAQIHHSHLLADALRPLLR